VISLTPITFDVFTAESILPLTKGSKVTLGSQDVLLNYQLAAAMIVKHVITIAHSAPSVVQRFVTDTKAAVSLKGLRLLMLAGEPLLENLVQHLRQLVGGAIFNLYGPTETTIYSTARDVTVPGSLSIGKPVSNTGIYILGKNDCLQPVGMTGELCIGGLGVARGYLNRPELTEEKFISSPFVIGERIYRTGDLARWLPTGDIEYIGRIDHQVKLGGVRIEPGEIENSLMVHPDISEAVVVVKTNKNGEEYLCAYLVANEPLAELDIRAWISVELPIYMIPALFVQLEKMPITTNGKVDRKVLAGLEISRQSNTNYIAPADGWEEKLVEIWAEALELPVYAISMEANFFELGGHSLKAISILAQIHKIFNIRVPLLEMFKTPSVRGIAGFIRKAKQDKFYFIEEVEKKEYYNLSSAQKRLYILQQMELASTVYNIPEIIPLTIIPDLEKFQNTFIRLIKRHESLRTSFHLVNDEPVQRVHDGVDFEISYYQLNADDRERMKVVNIFDRAFDLSQAPLLKVGVVKTIEAQYFLVVVMHHIISDGVSHQILVNDFMTLFADDRDDVLPPLRIQYKDFSQWQNSQQEKNRIKSQETYWLKEFEGAIPVLNLPTDFNRPDVQLFKGSGLNGAISIDTEKLRAIARENGATTFIVMLTIFYIFLYKMTGQEDIVIGTPVSGRRHADLEKIIGMFVNSLPLRNRPVGEKSFIDFLQEVRLNTLAAFENQEYQFEDLVEKLSVKRDRHNPIFDVMFTCQEQDIEERVDAEKKEEIYSSPSEQKPYEHADFRTSKFDFTLNIVIAKKLVFYFEYSSELFKKKTIEIFADGLKEIVLAIMPNKNIKLKDINITTFLADADNSKIQEELSGMEF
ncbi:MAG TPA: condensation domain-containing protein, partial [Candidatus Deferrimicrobium sp.]|nr:condensation domain-containing protein [Candidatus Deferrimicrobium sp.]